MPIDTNARIERALAIDMVRVTEETALAVSGWMGKGDERAADDAAITAMHRALSDLAIDGTIVVGEGDRDQTDRLFVGETIGLGGPPVDVALDALEGSNICARGVDNAITCMAMAEPGCLLEVPDVYMDKIAVGPGLPDGVVSLDADPADNVHALAEAKRVKPEDLLVCILDRPRHEEIIGLVREAGARIKLITDGDIAAIAATAWDDMSIDMYMGIGGAPEGILAAAALRATGGQMQGRLLVRNDDERERVRRHGVDDPSRVYTLTDMAKGDVAFAATGVTDGPLLRGVKRERGGARTQSVVMRSRSGTIRLVDAHHDFSRKSHDEA